MHIYQPLLFQDSGYLRKLPAIFRNGCLDVFYKKAFLKALQNSQENTVLESVFTKVTAPFFKRSGVELYQKDTPTQVFSCEFFGAPIFISQAKLLKIYFQLI